MARSKNFDFTIGRKLLFAHLPHCTTHPLSAEALRSEKPDSDPNDAHIELTHGQLTRTDILVPGIRTALAQFAKPT